MAKFLIRKNAAGKYWFVLKTANNKTVLQSQMYTTKQHADNGIRAIKDEAEEALMDDQTVIHHVHKPMEHQLHQP